MTARADAIAKAVERSKAEILADIAAGLVPATVADFSELHDYRDANTYGTLCDEDGFLAPFDDTDFESDAYNGPDPVFVQMANEVQNIVNVWLIGGRPSQPCECGHLVEAHYTGTGPCSGTWASMEDGDAVFIGLTSWGVAPDEACVCRKFVESED